MQDGSNEDVEYLYLQKDIQQITTKDVLHKTETRICSD